MSRNLDFRVSVGADVAVGDAFSVTGTIVVGGIELVADAVAVVVLPVIVTG